MHTYLGLIQHVQNEYRDYRQTLVLLTDVKLNTSC